MKYIAFTRALDSVGRIVIPMSIRNRFKLAKDDLIELYVEDDKIILQKFQDKCMFCGKSDDTIKFKNKFVCKKCREELKNNIINLR